MHQLSGQDASFLYMETPNAPMHIGSIQIYDQSSASGGRVRFKDILNNIRERLHLARTFRQKIVQVPLSLDHPYWIEDKDFDLEFHIRHIRLPEPGDWRQLCIQAARLHSRPLDLNKPLWEFTVIEGLDAIPGLPAGAFAIVSKIHHCAIDGMSGVDLIEAIHDLSPEAEPVQPPGAEWQGEAAPNPLELMVRAQLNMALQPLRFAEVTARAVPALARLSQGVAQREFEAPNTLPPMTRFSKPVSAHRVVEGRSFRLDDIKSVRKAVDGATVNDVVLTVVGGGLRRYLQAKNELPAEAMIAMAPISVRDTSERGSMGNKVAAMTANLGTDIEDPLQRLQVVHEKTKASKAMTNAVGAKLMTDYSQFIPSTTAGLAARLYSEFGMAGQGQQTIPFNCVVTNVPGPQFPLYSTGARLVGQFGFGPIYDGMGLIFPVVSYCGQLTISFTSCRDMIPDPDFFAQCLEKSFEELKLAVLGPEADIPAFAEI